MGPLTYAGHHSNVKGFISRALDSGAQLEMGGTEPSGNGYFLEPTIISGVAQDSEIVQSEVFGPVITIQQVSGDWEAIDLANAVEYGLGASVYTENVGVAMEAARRLQFGTVWINDHGAVTAEMPWGGFKQSGYGKERSVYSLEDYTQIKHVMVRLPQD
jgi:betaine-aldehyde dehydrogenase/aminobutyraldehyde dehydrogenase